MSQPWVLTVLVVIMWLSGGLFAGTLIGMLLRARLAVWRMRWQMHRNPRLVEQMKLAERKAHDRWHGSL